jgi:hypothetical protein
MLVVLSTGITIQCRKYQYMFRNMMLRTSRRFVAARISSLYSGAHFSPRRVGEAIAYIAYNNIRNFNVSTQSTGNDLIASTPLETISPIQIAAVLKSYSKHNRVKVLAPHFRRWAQSVRSAPGPWRTKEISKLMYGLKDIDLAHYPGALELAIAAVDKCVDGTEFTTIDIAQMMLGLGQTTFNSRFPVKNRDLMFLLDKMGRIVSTSVAPFNDQAIGNSLYALRGMSSDVTIVKDLVQLINTKLKLSSVALSGQSIGNGLYGLRNMNSDSIEIRELLNTFSERLTNRTHAVQMTDLHLASAIYGLRNMSSSYVEVRTMVARLAGMLAMNTESLSDQYIGNLLYGLQNKSDEHEEVRQFLKTLAERIQNSSDVYVSGRGVGGLFGLQHISAESAEARHLVRVFTDRILASEGLGKGMIASNISGALFGIRNMSSDHAEVRRLISALTVLCNKNDKLIFDCYDVSELLHGLKSMKCNHEEVRQLIASVSMRIQHSNPVFQDDNLAFGLMGLQNLDGECVEVRELLSALATKLKMPENAHVSLKGDRSAAVSEIIRKLSVSCSEAKELLSALK